MNEPKKEISQKIINYAIWYYLKYFPSVGKLKQKLDQTFWPDSEKWQKYWGIFEEDIRYIIEEKMNNVIVEEQIISSKIRNYIGRWKNLNYIKSKLREKLFDEEKYEKILQEEFNAYEQSILDYTKVYKQIVILYKKNKSKNYIRQKFVERDYDKQWVEEILDDIFVEWEMLALQWELYKIIKVPFFSEWDLDEQQKKYAWDYLQTLCFTQKQKLSQKLVWKWFGFSSIQELYSELEDSY